MRIRGIISLVVVLLASMSMGLEIPPGPVASAASPPSPLPAEGQRFTIEIRPEMELLAGVLSQTSWGTAHGPSGQGNEYFRALRDFLAPYKEHQAVKIAEELTRGSFVYDKPGAFICHLGPLPDLELKYEYDDALVESAGGKEKLEQFRLALRDLAEQSHFLDFIAEWRERFPKWIAAAAFDGDRVVEWLEGFFGPGPSGYRVILVPSQFNPNVGGSGAIISDSRGPIMYAIFPETGQSDNEPQFPEAMELEGLALHEWGHYFVNGALGRYPKEVASLEHLYRPVAQVVATIGYRSVESFTNEQVLRAVGVVAARDLYPDIPEQLLIMNEEASGFYLIRDVVKLLREYRVNRDVYPDFESFAPTLLERMAALPSKTERTVRRVLTMTTVVIVIGVFAIAVIRELRKGRVRSG